jgi:hypothetical protein
MTEREQLLAWVDQNFDIECPSQVVTQLKEILWQTHLRAKERPVGVLDDAQIVPNWAGEFTSYQQWVNKAQSWLKSPDHRRAMCVDALGRRCAMGADFMRARDEGTFPVRFFWECVIQPAAQQPPADAAVAGDQPFPQAWPHTQRAEAASAFLATYSDKNMEKLLGDYPVQPIIRALASMIGQWQQSAVNIAPAAGAGNQQAPTDEGQAHALADELEQLAKSIDASGIGTRSDAVLVRRACMALRQTSRPQASELPEFVVEWAKVEKERCDAVAAQCAAPDERAAWEADFRKRNAVPGFVALAGLNPTLTDESWATWQARASLAAPAPAVQPTVEARLLQVLGERAVANMKVGRNISLTLAQAAEMMAPASQPEPQPAAYVDEGDEGLFIAFVHGPDGSPLKRGDQLYTEPPAPAAQPEAKAAPAVAALSDEQIATHIDRPGFAWENLTDAEQRNLLSSIRELLAAAGNSQGQATQPAPFMFAIMGPDGKAYFDEHCVDPTPDALYCGVNALNDSPDAGYSVVPLYTAQPAAQPEQQPVAKDEPVYVVYSDDDAVDLFAAAMKAKMAASRAKGRGGWHDPDDCPGARLREMLQNHLGKGDPVDVGNFCMMLWNRGESTAAPVPAAAEPLSDEQIDRMLDSILTNAGTRLKYYTLPKSRDGMRAALRCALAAVPVGGA